MSSEDPDLSSRTLGTTAVLGFCHWDQDAHEVLGQGGGSGWKKLTQRQCCCHGKSSGSGVLIAGCATWGTCPEPSEPTSKSTKWVIALPVGDLWSYKEGTRLYLCLLGSRAMSATVSMARKKSGITGKISLLSGQVGKIRSHTRSWTWDLGLRGQGLEPGFSLTWWLNLSISIHPFVHSTPWFLHLPSAGCSARLSIKRSGHPKKM